MPLIRGVQGINKGQRTTCWLLQPGGGFVESVRCAVVKTGQEDVVRREVAVESLAIGDNGTRRQHRVRKLGIEVAGCYASIRQYCQWTW
jgi:hypothetical protein